ncbi:MAG: hypothetical protein HYZ20_19775 [Burkholderiales bacterium]|nr:hypothetical protein [Burkholderiales bacterium]
MTTPRIPRSRPMFSDTVPVPPPRCSSDACGQGRKPCPTPVACQCDDDPGLPGGAMALFMAIGIVSLVAVVSLAFGVCTGALP